MNLAATLQPGNPFPGLFHVTKADDRTLIKILFWNLIVVVGALVVYL
jgi:hypothetical protein